MGAPSTIGVDDDLSSSESSISFGTTNVEFTGGVDDDLGAGEHLSGADLLDNLLSEGLGDLFVGDGGIVLGGDEDVVDGNGFDLNTFLFVLNDNL